MPDPDEAREDKEAFASWLRELREAAGLSQRELAQAIDTDERSVRRWENADADPYARTLLRIFRAVGVELSVPEPGVAPGAVNAELAKTKDAVLKLTRTIDASLERIMESAREFDAKQAVSAEETATYHQGMQRLREEMAKLSREDRDKLIDELRRSA